MILLPKTAYCAYFLNAKSLACLKRPNPKPERPEHPTDITHHTIFIPSKGKRTKQTRE